MMLDAPHIPRQIEKSISAIVPSETSDDARKEIWARIVWSTIVEPGDRVAGHLIEVCGASTALELMGQKNPMREIFRKISAKDPLTDPIGEDIAQALVRWKSCLSRDRVENVIEHALGIGAYVVSPESDLWPQGFNDLHHHAPIVVWARGLEEHFRSFSCSLAVVGSRASTRYGEDITAEIVRGIATKNIGIVSGAAYGIDAVAHRTALAADGMTMAFMAGGVDRFYPSGNEALLTRMLSHGLILSEMPCGMAPTKWRFLQRNRLIAAATQSTLVVEAGWRSGSLNTANHAASLGRGLGAVPGPITSLASAGCHRLLREYNAQCVTSVDEVLELSRV